MTYFEGEVMRYFVLVYVVLCMMGSALNFRGKDTGTSTIVAFGLEVAAFYCVIKLLF